MAGGIELMLKAMGIDPQKLLAEFGTQFAALQKTVNEIHQKLTRIETKLDSLAVEVEETETEK